MRCQSRFDARYWMLGAGALGRPRGMEWGGRREESWVWGIIAPSFTQGPAQYPAMVPGGRCLIPRDQDGRWV